MIPYKIGYFNRAQDFAHMELPELLRGIGLGLKGASKTEREQRATSGSKFVIHLHTDSNFHGLMTKKLGYVKEDQVPTNNPVYTRYSKKGKPNSKDNMDNFHRIEAMTQTGVIRTYTFPIQKQKKK